MEGFDEKTCGVMRKEGSGGCGKTTTSSHSRSYNEDVEDS